MKTKLAVSVQMCGVRRLEQWIYSIYSASMSLLSATEWTVIHVSPLSSKTKPSALDVSTVSSNTSRSSLLFDAPGAPNEDIVQNHLT